MIKFSDNKYRGAEVDTSSLPSTQAAFRREMEQLINALEDRELLWIHVPIQQSSFIPVLTRLGFVFHHCEENQLTMVRKMTEDAFVPTTRNFIVGVGAIVLHKGQLLVVRDRFSRGYKLPGGHIDKNESIKDAVQREVLEETGVRVAFESIMNIGHFRHAQFGEANLYMVCTALPLTEDICIQDSPEIAEACWMDPQTFLTSGDTNQYNRSVVAAALRNKELKLTAQTIPLRVPDGEVFF
jgi:8-oxo-dGTP diphosphatase